jgi:hypothetical protein
MGNPDDAIVSSDSPKPKEDVPIAEKPKDEVAPKVRATIVSIQGEKAAQFLANIQEDRNFTYYEEIVLL